MEQTPKASPGIVYGSQTMIYGLEGLPAGILLDGSVGTFDFHQRDGP